MLKPDGIGLRVPMQVLREKCAQYMKHGKPMHVLQLMNNDEYSIVTQYQAEYRGIVQYYMMAYNLHVLNWLKYVAGASLVKTLANKYKTTCAKIYKRYGTKIKVGDKEYKVIRVTIERESPKKPLNILLWGNTIKMG